MSIHPVKRKRGRGYEVRYWDGQRKRSKTFDRKADAEAFEDETRRRKRLGTLADLDAGTELLCDFAQDWFRRRLAQQTLAPVTYRRYAEVWDKHVLPRIGGLQLREIRPGLLPTMSGGYAVVADDSPLGYPRVGDVEKVGPRWLARPMVGRDSWHRTRKDAVAAVVTAVREVNAASEQAERVEAAAGLDRAAARIGA